MTLYFILVNVMSCIHIKSENIERFVPIFKVTDAVAAGAKYWRGG